jgi:hypothetical protein
MKLIAHRGNINGPDPNRENTPYYILEAILSGYNVEADVWFDNGTFVLGHDSPQYEISEEFLTQKSLWIHCKNINALSKLIENPKCNCFFHDTDDVVLTSKNYLWTYPGKLLYSSSICVLPELSEPCDISNVAGICSDFIGRYKHD